MIGGLLAIGIWNWYSYSNLDNKQVDNNLTKLSNQISTSFQSEVDSALLQLVNADNAFRNPMNVGDKSIPKRLIEKIKTGQLDTTRKWLHAYPNFKSINWIDKYGWQKYKWTSDTKASDLKQNVSARSYFDKAFNGKTWRKIFYDPDIKSMDTIGYYLESIDSWTSYEKLIVLSIPHIKKPGEAELVSVASLSAPFISVLNPLLPKGYGFAIISQDGAVQFHSNSYINLNQNLFDELDNPATLREAVHSHHTVSVNVNYNGHDQRMMTHPLADMPLTLVTFYNLENLAN